ncbi:chaperonin Hsp60, mitochondrial precursor,putative [Trypanosoma brucei gambiense DAL972]|uniref:Chaperonin HSP60, mitochondrial n=1 Tax=Trypanosoma brucei gambiense (strain MHOM/CI/86/DAL972) TaxID=679716 RepID=C9ZR80_TRYB9|nr:chaperonin Hsp60, mitochondrial precursor,putative [Trypanosoma brucei gambiense DAL972]CBH11910.1 chaperonin Hsp60, mitochondrial precursor,putative [Trypanosoma brucei gambiense DAL972]|eukprot:XP_011774195.1 chaperonin Hsp60, mitochondrial precursor,putative [Trypanosoma brucei gambiense DAL972]
MLYSTRRLASAAGKAIHFGGEARERMLNGIERIATAVGVTLGPKGRNVIIRQPSGEPKITKDGVTVAQSIEFNDQFEDVGARLIRQVAGKTNDIAGDGTTTATILAWSIFAEGYKCVATGANPMDLKRGIDIAVDVLLKSLSEQKRPVKDLQMLENVATISANGERSLGALIARVVQSVGVNGYIAVLSGNGSATEWMRYDGWSVEQGFVSSALVTNTTELKSSLESPFIFITAEKLESVHDVLRLLGAAKNSGKPLVLVAPQFSEAVLQTVIHNHVNNVVLCGIVCAPELSEEELHDLATCCQCRVEKVGSIGVVDDVTCLLGRAERWEQTMDSTVVAGVADAAPRVRLLQGRLERALTEDVKEKLRERISKLNRTFAVIRVGGRSTVEINESKDRVIDAVNAAQNALAEGIVAGGGAALLHASKQLDVLMREDEDMEQDRRTGILIVRNAARLPMKRISENAGEEGAVTVETVAEYEDCCMGYDAQNDRYVDMFEVGIVDPVKVVNSCVVDAASVAGLMITTEASVCDFKEERRQRDSG